MLTLVIDSATEACSLAFASRDAWRTPERMMRAIASPALKSNASVRVLIVGHTDSDGAAAHNLDLSQRRAAAVKNYLVTHGIDGSRLQSDSSVSAHG